MQPLQGHRGVHGQVSRAVPAQVPDDLAPSHLRHGAARAGRDADALAQPGLRHLGRVRRRQDRDGTSYVIRHTSYVTSCLSPPPLQSAPPSSSSSSQEAAFACPPALLRVCSADAPGGVWGGFSYAARWILCIKAHLPCLTRRLLSYQAPKTGGVGGFSFPPSFFPPVSFVSPSPSPSPSPSNCMLLCRLLR